LAQVPYWSVGGSTTAWVTWIQTNQRATDRTHQRLLTSERPTQPRPHEQRGRRGPERAAG
jgi:hypothetical protein